MPRQDSERFTLDVPFEDAMHKLLGVDTDNDGDGDDGEDDADQD